MLHRFDAVLPIRYWVLTACILLTAGSLLSMMVWQEGGWVFVLSSLLMLRGVAALGQTQHAITRNYPIIGHLRFLLEFIRPEIRQYFIESDREAAPFSRAQRSLIYQRAKRPITGPSAPSSMWASRVTSGSTTRWHPAKWPPTTFA